jgi:redox-sensing transcriptional repressor
MNRLGYDMHDICGAIRSDLGFDQRYEAILLGSGHLGRALLTYSGFSRYGLHILRAFSSDSDHVGHRLGSCTIKPMRELEPFLRNRLIPLVILVPPTEASEELAHRLVAAGVKAIWNFTPTHLLTPRLGVLVRNEKHFSLGLSEISYHLKE